MKGEGVLAGFSDLIIVADRSVLFVEVKTKEGRQSELQRKFQANIERLGFQYFVCRSLQDFQLTVEKWLRVAGRRKFQFSEQYITPEK